MFKTCFVYYFHTVIAFRGGATSGWKNMPSVHSCGFHQERAILINLIHSDDDIWPLPDEVEGLTFIDEFNVKVNYDASGGWAVILLLFIIEIGLVYATAIDRR